METHAGYPSYEITPRGSWKRGIGDLLTDPGSAPKLLRDWVAVAYSDKQNVPEHFPSKRIYLGSAAQVYHLLREKGKHIRMTLFEMGTEPAEELRQYFSGQGAETVLIRPESGGVNWSTAFLRKWWDEAVHAAAGKDVVMVVEGDSYKLAPSLWENNDRKPDLVFVDPFNLEDDQPNALLDSLNEVRIPFMCWTPLFSVKNWNMEKWSFKTDQNDKAGNKKAKEFVDYCRSKSYELSWFCWKESKGIRKMYGCQLAFGNVFDQQFTPTALWEFPGFPGQLPYLDINSQVVNARQPGANFRNPNTTFQTPGQPVNQDVHRQIPSRGKPGVRWWGKEDKYHAAFWWNNSAR